MPKICRSQFEILDFLHERKGKNTIEDIVSILNKERPEIESEIKTLQEAGCLNGLSITESGYSALEPYRAKRAVFVAAG